jgi:hypothetical protein
MFDFETKATHYRWQALKHEEQALRAKNATLKNGFAGLAEMCLTRAAQMERQAQLMKDRRLSYASSHHEMMKLLRALGRLQPTKNHAA